MVLLAEPSETTLWGIYACGPIMRLRLHRPVFSNIGTAKNDVKLRESTIEKPHPAVGYTCGPPFSRPSLSSVVVVVVPSFRLVG